MKPEHRIYLVVCLAAMLPAIFVFVGHPGDDVLFHVSSWMEMLEGWRAGVAWPAWASHADFNLGEPRFYFYPPLARVIGAVLLTVLPVSAVNAVFVWAVLALAGLATLRLSTGFLPLEDRLLAALMGVTSYYLNVLALVRFAMAELITAALLPLIFFAYLRILAHLRRRGTVRDCTIEIAVLAFLLAGAWLSDAPAAVALTYALVLTTCVEGALQRTVRPFGALLIAEAAALGLSAWYLLPAMLARHQINAGWLTRINARELMLFHAPGSSISPAMKFPLWIWSLLGVVVALLAARHEALPANTLRPNPPLPLQPLAVMASIALLCQLPVSLPLWNALPQFAYIQIPFRFDSILGAMLPVMALKLFTTPFSRRFLYAVWVLFFLVPVTMKLAQQVRQPQWPQTTAVARVVPQGYSGYAEYNTAGVAMDASADRSAATMQALGDNPSVCVANVETWKPEMRQMGSRSEAACTYRVALHFYPAWHLWIDNHAAPLTSLADGTARIAVPPGHHTLLLRFVRPLQPACAGAAISCSVCCLLIAVLYREKRSARLRALMTPTTPQSA